MEADDLMYFFKNVYLKDVRYCAICLRSEKVVRLSSPLVLRKILGALKYFDSFQNENICYMCEARASAMSRFVDMIQWSSEIQVAFQRTIGRSTGNKRFKHAQENADTYERVFNNIRVRNELRTSPTEHVACVTKRSRPMRLGGKFEVIGRNNKNIEKAAIETVVIDDDNSQDDINSNPLMSDQTSIQPENILVPSDSDDSNSTIYSVSTTSEGKTSCDTNKNDTCTLPDVSPRPKKVRRVEINDDEVQVVMDEDSSKTESKLEEDPKVDGESNKLSVEVTASRDSKFMDSAMQALKQALMRDIQNMVKMRRERECV